MSAAFAHHGLLMAAAAGAAAPVTWNPSDKDAGADLSGGNLVASKIGTNGYSSVRATSGKSSGKWEFTIEATGTGTSPSELLIGIMDAGASISDFVGASVNSYGKDSVDTNLYSNGTGTNLGFQITTGDRVTFYCDLTAHTLQLSLNGATPVPASPLAINSATYFPAATVTKAGSDVVTLDCLTASSHGLANGFALWS